MDFCRHRFVSPQMHGKGKYAFFYDLVLLLLVQSVGASDKTSSFIIQLKISEGTADH